MRCAAAVPHDATRALQERHVDATQGVDFHTLPTYGRNRCNCNSRPNEMGGGRGESVTRLAHRAWACHISLRAFNCA